jgi:hypothetical protein
VSGKSFGGTFTFSNCYIIGLIGFGRKTEGLSQKVEDFENIFFLYIDKDW